MAEALVVAADGLDGDTGAIGHLDQRRPARRCGSVVQAAQPAQRGESPDLVTAGGNLERVDVVGGEQLALVEIENRTRLRGALGRFGDTRTH